MSRRTWVALAVLVVIAVGLLVTVVVVPWGDHRGPGRQDAAVYREGDAVNVAKGDEFVIALAANPSTGYSWTAADSPYVQQVSSKQVQHSSLIGAPGTEEITFKAEKTGSITLELAYARSFEGGVPPAQTASFPVTIR